MLKYLNLGEKRGKLHPTSITNSVVAMFLLIQWETKNATKNSDAICTRSLR